MIRMNIPLTIFVLVFPALVFSQEVGDNPRPPPGYTPPTKEEWSQAGLEPIEYDLAIRYEVTLDDWKNMDSSRRAHHTAGWSCLAAGLLTPAIEATIIWGGGIPWDADPQRYVFIMVTIAAGAAVLTGIVLLAGAPGPEDFKEAWLKKQSETSWLLLPSPNGLQFSLSF